jgi:Tropinone reductase 1
MNQTYWNLQGKNALITGGTRGIGRAIVEEFLQLGANVFIVSKNKNSLDEKIKTWRNAGHPVHGLAVDLSKNEAYSSAINEMTKKWDVLDILINNAGTNIRKSAQDYESCEYDEIMQTNLT